jgi:hypothetical protein
MASARAAIVLALAAAAGLAPATPTGARVIALAEGGIAESGCTGTSCTLMPVAKCQAHDYSYIEFVSLNHVYGDFYAQGNGWCNAVVARLTVTTVLIYGSPDAAPSLGDEPGSTCASCAGPIRSPFFQMSCDDCHHEYWYSRTDLVARFTSSIEAGLSAQLNPGQCTASGLTVDCVDIRKPPCHPNPAGQVGC